MARQEINVGAAPTGAGGDTTRSTAAKINAMTQEIYTSAFFKSNILGQVSQANGVPTGAVIQYGSNTNGSFVRFADGTQICWQRASTAIALTSGPANGLYYGSVIWTFPAQFLAEPVATCSAQSDGVLTIDLGGPSTVSMFSPGVGALSSISSRTYSLNLFAIGRWY